MHSEISKILEFLNRAVKNRLDQFFQGKAYVKEVYKSGGNEPVSKFIRHMEMNEEQIIILACALAPHIIPGFFDKIIQEYLPQGGELPEFGGTKGEVHRGMIPTGETVLFILSGMDIEARFQYLNLFNSDLPLFRHKIITLEQVKTGEPRLSGRLILDPEYVEVFTTGKISLPILSVNFPAEHLLSDMTWEDLVLPEGVWHQIRDLEIWLRHKNTLQQEWDIGRKVKPGYRVLFHGPPGTGKTLTASLLGKYTGKDVFRIDLSMVVSKYIGETEKNLANLFDKADNKDWILFFDEADAIFGKRTGVRDAHDKYANQEVSYLLQRIEAYNGLVILATNFKSNLDPAFVRRFNALIYFPPPLPKERFVLWQKSIPDQLSIGEDLILEEIAQKYDLTGAHILNVVQYLSLSALEKREFVLSKEIMLNGIRRELEKEGK